MGWGHGPGCFAFAIASTLSRSGGIANGGSFIEAIPEKGTDDTPRPAAVLLEGSANLAATGEPIISGDAPADTAAATTLIIIPHLETGPLSPSFTN